MNLNKKSGKSGVKIAGLPFLKLNLSKVSFENGLNKSSKDFVLKKMKFTDDTDQKKQVRFF